MSAMGFLPPLSVDPLIAMSPKSKHMSFHCFLLTFSSPKVFHMQSFTSIGPPLEEGKYMTRKEEKRKEKEKNI
jgi:hypothetical protein